MDRHGFELLALLTSMLETYQQLKVMAEQRHEAMRTFDVERLNGLVEREKGLLEKLEQLERNRKMVVETVRMSLGRGVDVTTSEIAKRCPEPLKTRLLVTASALREAVETVNRHNRINSKVAQAVVASLSKVLKVVTGITQHAGTYMRNGRKAGISGIHLLEVTA